MYSSTTTQASSRQGGYTKNHAPQVPQGFTVRVFKGPSIYSFPQTTPCHFDRGYQSIPLSEPRQSSNNLNWYTRAQTTTLAPNESHDTSRPPTSSGTSLSNDTRLLTSDPSLLSRPPIYSIYQSANDAFIYESSLSSKADLSSNSEDGDYTSSAFSPAMSTDSITTVRDANTPNASFTDLRTSAPAPAPTSSSSRISFPLNIPGLAQAQTAIKGIFRGQAQNDSQSAANASFSASSGPSAWPSVAKPIRVTENVSRSGDRGSSHNERALSGDNAHLSASHSAIPDDEDSEVDPIAKANAEYNAATSKPGSSMPYYSSVRDPVHPSVANSSATGTGVRSATGPLHPNLTLHSGHEQYHTQATTSHVQPSYWGAPEMTGPHSMANGHSSHFPSRDPVATTAQIPLSQSSGPSSRYVPASHTMPSGPLSTSPEPTTNRERHEHNPYVPSSLAREPKVSVSRITSTFTASQAAVHHEGGGASTSRPVPSVDETRRGPVGRQAPYAPYRADPPASQEPSTFTTSHQTYNAPSTHHATATVQSNREAAPEASTWYIASMATRPSGSVISHTTDHRASPEQAYMYPSQQPIPQPYNYTALPSGERASNYVTSASTRGTNTSPPRTRKDSNAASSNSLYTRPSNVEASTTLTTAQGRPQQNMRTSIYEPQNSRIDDAHNTRGRDYGSRPEADRAMANPYSRTSERQASHVSNAYGQRCPDVTSSSSSSARNRLETPAVPDPSQIPFPAPVREPQRRYSDADSSIAGQSTYGPIYGSTSGANVLPTATGTTTEASRTTEPQPQRRYSDGESNVADRASLTLFRTVRWNENLICPSPIFPHERRKGWFNRRGDQLWTNDGAYKPPTPGQEYPSDLDGYPERGNGWMNEQGVRIDMAHRLIPKAPLKSALKHSRAQSTAAQQEN